MPQYGYSFEGFDPAVHVRASGREVNISPKAAREIAVTIKGMTLAKAIDHLELVEDKKMAIAFRRHKLKVGHRSELQGFPTGSYPVKAARAYLDLQNSGLRFGRFLWEFVDGVPKQNKWKTLRVRERI